MANDWLREEFEGFKNFENNVGSAIVSGWESLTTKVGDFFNDRENYFREK